MTDKQIIDEERMFECVWCKYEYPESVARVILSSEPNECVCNGCLDEWIDETLCQLDQLKAENKHLNDLLNQALNEIEAIQDAYEERE